MLNSWWSTGCRLSQLTNHCCLGALVFALAGLSFTTIQDEKQKPEATNQSSKDNNKSREEAEFERRLNSIAKTIEKEDRPARPEFQDRAAGKGAITFDDLKFEMKKSQRFRRSMLTDSINQMVGERLQIKGYIHPNSKQRGMKKFIFVRDDKECCFGPTAALYDCVLVTSGQRRNRQIHASSGNHRR